MKKWVGYNRSSTQNLFSALKLDLTRSYRQYELTGIELFESQSLPLGAEGKSKMCLKHITAVLKKNQNQI